MFFLVKYASALESGSFRGRSADFAWMLGLCGCALLCAAPLAKAQFLGAPLAFALVYVWARRHPAVLMSFVGVLTVTAPWLPWVLLGVSVLRRGSATVDLLGMAVGERGKERAGVEGKERGCARAGGGPPLIISHVPSLSLSLSSHSLQATATTSWRTCTRACRAGRGRCGRRGWCGRRLGKEARERRGRRAGSGSGRGLSLRGWTGEGAETLVSLVALPRSLWGVLGLGDAAAAARGCKAS